MGREDLIGDARYSTPAARRSGETRSTRSCPSWTRQHDKHEAMRLVGSATVPAGAVLDTRELADDRPSSSADPPDHGAPDGRRLRHERLAGALRRRAAGRRPAPLLGQHGGDVLADWLKMDGDAIGKLKAGKVIAEAK